MLRVAVDELARLRATQATNMVFGADIDYGTAQWAAHLVAHGVPPEHLKAADFLSLTPEVDFPLVAAVVGNPPYVRHHRLTPAARSQAAAAMTAAGVTLSGRASLWAYFVVHGARFVESGGRMALLLPGAVLQADYAPAVLAYLEKSFDDVLLVRVRERIFGDAQEETVALLASGARIGGASSTCQITEVGDLDDLERLLAAPALEVPRVLGVEGIAAWKRACVPAECLRLLERVLASDRLVPLGQVAHVRLGTVTGANSVFVLSDKDVDRLGVWRDTVPVVTRSAWLPGPVLTGRSLRTARADMPGQLLTLHSNFALDRRTRLGRHIVAAEAVGVALRYHCQREPWWALGDVPVPNAFLPYMVSTPRGITMNEANAGSTNTVHQVQWRRPPTVDQERSWVLSTWSALGRICAELYGRHYGGGVLKLELSAAQRLPVVNGLTVRNDEWAACRQDRSIAQVLADGALLGGQVGLNHTDVELMHQVAVALAAQRVGRRQVNARNDSHATLAAGDNVRSA